MKKRMVNILLVICIFMSILPKGIETKGVENSNKENKYGYVDSGLKIYEQPSPYVKDIGNLPSRFDLREENGVTSVKNQDPYGTCWAFATMASVESNLKYTTGKDVDLSEINLALDRVGINGLKIGGNFIMSSDYFADGRGPVLEKDDPYPANGESPVNRNAQATYNVMNSLYLPARKNSLDNDNIKEAIINNGAVAISYNHSQDYLADDGVSYYYNGGTSTNHAVALVGWDDNYPKEKFKNSPPRDGAFIFKNSWGSDFGDNGYFYISYYDTSLGNNLILTTNNTEWIKNIDNRYTYGKYSINSYYRDTSTASDIFIADVNTAKNNELLSALSIYTFSTNSPYEIYIDENYNESNYPDGDISYILNKKRKSGILEYAGLNNIKLDSPIEVQPGKRFMVAVKYKDVAIPDLKFSDNAGENNSFFIYSNTLIESESANPLIVYSYNKAKESATDINIDKTSLALKIGEKSQIKANLVGGTYSNEKFEWTSSNPKVAVVDEDGLVTGRGNGSATITVSNRSGTVKKTISVSINTNLGVVKDFTNMVKGENSITFDDVISSSLDYWQIKLVDDDGNGIPISKRIDNKKLCIRVNDKRLTHATLYIPKNAVNNSVNKGLINDLKIDVAINTYDETDKVTLGSEDIMKAIASQYGKSQSEVNVADIKKLKYISINSENNVDLKDLEFLSSLIGLSIHTNGEAKNIQSIKLLRNLKSIDLAGINMVNLSYLKDTTALEYLTINNCKMISLEGIENLKNLYQAYIYNNNINNIKGIEKLDNLECLSLCNNQITDITDLANCTKLLYLYIASNKIKNIDAIKNLTRLKTLNCRHNYIKDLEPIEACTNLRNIDIEENEVEDLTPLKTLSALESDGNTELYVNNNKISVDDSICKYLNDVKGWHVSNTEQKPNLYEINGFNVSKNDMNSKNDLVFNFNKDIDKSWNIEFCKCDSNNNKINLPFSVSENKIYVDNKLDTEGKESKYKIHCNIDYIDSNGAKQTINTDIDMDRTGFYTEDINKDKTVDITDLAEVASHYNESAKGEIDNWQYDKDINRDGVIDLYDLVDIARAM